MDSSSSMIFYRHLARGFVRATLVLLLSAVIPGSATARPSGKPVARETETKKPAAKPEAPPDPAEVHFRAAQTYQLTADYGRAASEYRQAIALSLQRLGNARTAENDFPQAIALLSTAAKILPDNDGIAVDLAIAYYYSGDFEKATAGATAVLQHDPRNFRAHDLLGKTYFMESDFQKAAQELQAALDIKTDFDVAYTLAMAHLQLKELPKATVLFDEMQASLGPTPQLHVLIGRAFSETGYEDLAQKEFSRAIALDPKYPRAHAYLGTVYLFGPHPKPDLAQQAFQAELKLNPADYRSRLYLGIAQMQEKNYAAAQASLQEAMRLNPKDPEAYFNLGRVLLANGQAKEAVAALRQALALAGDVARNTPEMAQAHTLLAQALEKSGRHEDAAAESARASAITAALAQKKGATAAPGPPASQNLRSVLMETARQTPAQRAAEQEYRKSVSQLLGNAYHNLGVIDARAGRYSQAADEFAQAAHWDAAIPSLDRNWGLAAFRAEKYAMAIEPLSQQLRHDPSDHTVREMLGLSYYMVDDFAKSAVTFRPIADQLPDNPGLLYAAGIALVRKGDAATGAKLFTRMLQHNENVAEVHVMLGQAYAQQGEWEDARRELARALQLKPGVPEAHFYTGMVDFKQGKLDQAAQQFEAELAVNPSNTPAKYQLAFVRLQQRQTDEAVRLLSQVIAQTPDYADAHYQLGKAMLEKGDIKAAIQQLETATKLQPTDYAYYQLSIAYRRDGQMAQAQQALASYQQLKSKAQKQVRHTN